jgi:membrane dipeptidase
MGVEHVGLGADFIRQVTRSGAVATPPDALLPDGLAIDATVEGLVGPDDYPNLLEAMSRRGMSDADVAAVAGGSFVRLLKAGLPA